MKTRLPTTRPFPDSPRSRNRPRYNLQEKGLRTADAQNLVMDNNSDGCIDGAISAASRLANVQRPVKQGAVFCGCRVSGIRYSHVVDIWAYEARSSPYRIERNRGCRGFGLSANNQILFVIKKRRRTCDPDQSGRSHENRRRLPIYERRFLQNGSNFYLQKSRFNLSHPTS
jgi:hypothetical protein